MTTPEAMDGLFNHPGVSFWIHGTGEQDTVRIRIRWAEFAAPSLAERFGCAPRREEIGRAIIDGMRVLFDDVRELRPD